MTLTAEQTRQLETYLRVPWTLVKSYNVDDGYHVLRVRELPSVLATGKDEPELSADFWEAMRATLSSYLADGERIPLPAGYEVPRPVVRVIRVSPVEKEGDSWQHTQEHPITGAPFFEATAS